MINEERVKSDERFEYILKKIREKRKKFLKGRDLKTLKRMNELQWTFAIGGIQDDMLMALTMGVLRYEMGDDFWMEDGTFFDEKRV
jgi:hypothetical protein